MTGAMCPQAKGAWAPEAWRMQEGPFTGSFVGRGPVHTWIWSSSVQTVQEEISDCLKPPDDWHSSDVLRKCLQCTWEGPPTETRGQGLVCKASCARPLRSAEGVGLVGGGGSWRGVWTFPQSQWETFEKTQKSKNQKSPKTSF